MSNKFLKYKIDVFYIPKFQLSYICDKNPSHKVWLRYVIYDIIFDFGEGVTIIDLRANMNLYVSYIVESYKNTMICNLGNTDKVDLLIHTVQCWCACTVDKDYRDLPMVIKISGMMYKYYLCIGFIPIKHNKEGKEIHNKYSAISHIKSKTVFMSNIFKIFMLCTTIKY